MNEKINITKADGASITADIICFIENTNTNKRYVYYTLNEIVGAGPNSTVKIYVSKVKQDNPTLDAPISEEDWGVLKGYMGDSLKGTSNPELKYLPLSELGTPVSVSERAIAMPTSYDYINKQRGIYAQNVATAQPTAPVEPVEAAPVAEPVAPVVETPVIPEPTPVESPIAPQETVATPEPTTVEPDPVTPTEPAVESPVQEPVPVTTPVEEDDSSSEDESGTAMKMEPIDLATIEAKYDEMINEVNKLKEMELEAAKRYNASIELNSMHMDQHANYIQNDLKENGTIVETAPTEPSPVVSDPTLVAPEISAPTTPNVAPATIEPTPITPVVPEPTPAMSAQELETNWFDMPANN